MNAINYDLLMQKEIQGLEGKAKLLLHCCCAPCSSACLEKLFEHFDITVLFYNPNIEDSEYFRRKGELLRLIDETGWAKVIDCDREEQKFKEAVSGLEGEKEGGKRCEKCFNLRLEKTCSIAESEGFDYFTTTLTISPLKNAEVINKIGAKLSEGKKVKWLYSDFKKRNGYLRSIELSKKHNLYRQNYCGCVYSHKNT